MVALVQQVEHNNISIIVKKKKINIEGIFLRKQSLTRRDFGSGRVGEQIPGRPGEGSSGPKTGSIFQNFTAIGKRQFLEKHSQGRNRGIFC